jgi:Leucine-rich repeat (LRR) protein
MISRLTRLQALILRYQNELRTDESIEPLNALSQLRMLDMYSTGISDAQIQKLKLPNLRVLNLYETKITDVGVGYLAENFPNLEVLDISSTLTSEVAFVYLSKLKNLQMLNLYGVGEKSLPHLAKLTGLRVLYGVYKTKLPYLKELKNLCAVDACILNDNDIALLKPFPQIHQFSTTSWEPGNISDEGLKSLQDFSQLTTLNLRRHKKITPSGFQYLKPFKNLMVLNLSSTNIDDTGLEHIKDLTNLHALNLSYTQVTDAGLVHLSHLQNLMELDISHTRITYKGFEHLRNLQGLRILNVRGIKLSDWRKQQVPFAEALLQIPNLRVIKMNVLQEVGWEAREKLWQLYDGDEYIFTRKRP